MLVSDFDFTLPEDLVAQRPAPRGTSRLLVVGKTRRHLRIPDLPALLDPGDLLVVNDTRVLAARLFARVAAGGRVELLLVRRLDEREWSVLAKPGRRARPGARLRIERKLEGGGEDPHGASGLEAEVIGGSESGRYRVRFSEPIEPYLSTVGHVPLPPYIHRPDETSDQKVYQTVYARRPGAIAAPTAGLHFTESLLDKIRERGVSVARVTLHVGIGTFKPVRVDLVSDHRMDEEEYDVPEETAAAIRRTRAVGGRIVAVGTTVVRTLESAARAEYPERAGGGEVAPGPGRTELFIYPGFDFQVVDRLLTNFHLPRSSLLMLVSAFAGRERVLEAYREAVRERYRFYSYGDAMLIEPTP
jgi:S-adenosylmethionine:tRNA ribosyltransferase-isomerase